MSDDPHPCMKVTSHIRKFLTMTVSAVQIQEQNVPQITSDERYISSISISGGNNIAVLTLNQDKIIFSDDSRQLLLAPKKTQQLRTAIGAIRLQPSRFSLD